MTTITTTCTIHGIGPYFSGRDTEKQITVLRSRWDTSETLQDRILLEIGDNPFSARFPNVNNHELETIRLDSLQFTLTQRPSTSFSSLLDTVRTSPRSHLWSTEDILWCWLDHIQIQMATAEPDTIQDTIERQLQKSPEIRTLHLFLPGESPLEWYARKSLSPWKTKVRYAVPLPQLDAALMTEQGEEKDWVNSLLHTDPIPHGMIDTRSCFVYNVEPPTTTLSLKDIFYQIRLSNWIPNGPTNTCLCLWAPTSGFDEAVVQLLPQSLSFPWNGLSPGFFPFLNFGEASRVTPSEVKAEMERVFNTDIQQDTIYLYHDSFGWATFENPTTKSFRIQIVKKPAISVRDMDLLLQWEKFMGLSSYQYDRFRTVQDMGSYMFFLFRGIPQEDFSWFVFYDLLVSDNLFLRFFRISQKPTLLPTTETTLRSSPTSVLDLILQPSACSLWNISSSTQAPMITICLYLEDIDDVDADENQQEEEEEIIGGGVEESKTRTTTTRTRRKPQHNIELHIKTHFPVDQAVLPSMTDFFRSLILYTSKKQDEVMDQFEELGVKSLVKSLEQKFMSGPGLKAPPLQDLTTLFPRIFIPNYYKSLCQARLQPLLLTDDEAREIPNEEERMLFPDKEWTDPFGMVVKPQWYGCQSSVWKYPGLKRNDHEEAVFPVVPCCYKKPQHKTNRNKLLKIDLGVDIISVKRKDNIIRKNKIIRFPGQIGIVFPLFPEVRDFFLWNYSDLDIYRIGVHNSPYSFMECLQYVAFSGKNMPAEEYYPFRLINMIHEHRGLVQNNIPFRTTEDLVQEIRNPSRDFWIDPRIFLPLLEKVFETHIYVWTSLGRKDDSMHLIRSETPRIYTNCVYLLMHFGGRMNVLIHKPYPQCELLAWKPFLPLGESLLSTGLHLRFETRSFPLVRYPDRLWRRLMISQQSPLWTSQCLFPTGEIMGLQFKIGEDPSSSSTSCLWFSGNACLASLDLPMMGMTTTPSWMPTVQNQHQHLMDTILTLQKRWGTHLHFQNTVLQVHYKKKIFWVWRFNVLDSPWIHLVSHRMESDDLRSIIRLFVSSSSSTETIPINPIVECSSPPFRLLPVLNIMVSATVTPTTSMTPTLHPYHYQRQKQVIKMVTEATTYLFRHFLATMTGTTTTSITTWEEKIQHFLTRHTKVNVGLYKNVPFPLPSTIGGILYFCCSISDLSSLPTLPIIQLPTPKMVSRLSYLLHWKMVHEPNGMTPLPDLKTLIPLPYHSSSQEQPYLSSVDPRTVVYPLSNFFHMFYPTRQEIHQGTIMSSMTKTETSFNTGLLSVMIPPVFPTTMSRLVDIFRDPVNLPMSIFHDESFYASVIPVSALQTFIEETCPLWVDVEDSPFVLKKECLTAVANEDNFMCPGTFQWSHETHSYHYMPPLSDHRSTFVVPIPPPTADEEPKEALVLLHPTFFEKDDVL